MRFAIACAASLLTLTLVGCVTSSSSSTPQSKASPRLAAEYNARLAMGYMQQGRMDLAQGKLAEALQQGPKIPMVHNALALFYERTGRPAEADHQYKLSLRYDPGNPNTQNNYGAFLCRQGKYRQSIGYFIKASNNLNYSTPDSALANAGLCALKIPDKGLARKYFMQALAINNDQSQALWHLGLLGFEVKDYSRANNYLSRLIDLVPHPSALMLWVAIEAAWTSGHQTQAQHYGRELLKLYPNSSEAQKFIHLVGAGS